MANISSERHPIVKSNLNLLLSDAWMLNDRIEKKKKMQIILKKILDEIIQNLIISRKIPH